MKYLTLILITFLLIGCGGSGGESDNDNNIPLPVPEGRSLRTIMEDRYSPHNIIVGGTTGALCGAWEETDMPFSTNTCKILDREFNYVTPENDFKQWDIHPDNSDYWNWTKADLWIDHIADNHQILRIHGPIGPQVSFWAKGDDRTPSELEKNMKDFMKALCQRYNGIEGVEYMDVVNETVEWGDWHKPKAGYDWSVWENPWYIIGQDNDVNQTPLYIKMAFEIATQYAPDIKLIFNHHERPEMTFSWNLIKDTILYLRNMGLRVDGIGWQAHVEAGYEEGGLQKLRELIDWAFDNQLEFHITEASVWLYDGNSQEKLEKQAKTYSAILEVLLEKRLEGKVGWNIWHIDDGHGWHTEWYPSMFDENFEPKPAYYAVQETLENTSTASIEAIVSDFDANDEGWTVGGMATLTHHSTGGNPNGFLQLDENGGDTYYSIAPDKFLGNLSKYDGGTLSFDSIIFSPVPPPSITFGDGFGRVTIVGGGTTAQLDLAPNPPEYSWMTYVASLSATDWGVSQDIWNQILSDVTQITIIQESVVGWEEMGFDNFKIEPAP